MFASAGSGPLAGAERITLRAPASMCRAASARVRKRPVASITTSAPSASHGSSAPRVAFCEHLDPPAGDDECSVLGAHRVREAPVDGVEREEVGERVGVGDVVDGDDVELGVAFDRRAQDRTADPAEAVDGDTGGHEISFVQWIASIASPSCASRARSLRRASCRVL